VPAGSTLALFIASSYALAIVPGPAVLYILNRSLSRGRATGVYSALGIAAGGLAHVLAAAAGLSAIVTSSAVAFTAIKYAGAGYLAYLAYKALRSGDLTLTPVSGSNRRAFAQGIVVNILNPKTALFFLSFFPQFVDPARGPVLTQMLGLGVVFVTAALSSDILYALGAAWIRDRLATSRRARIAHRYVTAGIFLGLSATAALE